MEVNINNNALNYRKGHKIFPHPKSSSGIRSSIDLKDNGSIVGTDILTVLPFANALYKTKIFGRTLRKALEHSASMHEKDSNGGFLQMSGVHVTYDYCKPLNQRVVDVTVRCKRCTTPHYEPLDDNKMYSVIVPLFLLLGGDGHVFHEKDFDISRTVILKLNDAEALKAYIHKLGTVYPDTEQRITIRDECHANHSSSSTNPGMHSSDTNNSRQLRSRNFIFYLFIYVVYFSLESLTLHNCG